MSFQLGESLPDFYAETDKKIIKLSEWNKEKWTFLFSLPDSFSDKFNSDVKTLSELKTNFRSCNIELLGLCESDLESIKESIVKIEKECSYAIDFPIISDPYLNISRKLKWLIQDNDDYRTGKSIYLLNPAKKVMLSVNYPDIIKINFWDLLNLSILIVISGNKSTNLTPSRPEKIYNK